MKRWCMVWTLLFVATAHAQSGGVGQSGMEQGQAAINVRSDVKLGIKGTGGTTSERLAKLGEAVSAQMGEIRSCYRKQVATSPEVIGNLRAQVSLADRGDPKVAIEEGPAIAPSLSKCVTRAIESAKWGSVGRPAAAVLSLEFDNTRARGQALMNEREASASRVSVVDGPDGSKQATFATDGNEVTVTVTGNAKQSRENVELIVRAFHVGYAGFLDCRRRCEKGGLSPEGDIEAELALDARGKANIKIGRITVAHERAPICAERAFSRLTFDKPGAPVKASVLVHFAK
jgi:hypothetical protein